MRSVALGPVGPAIVVSAVVLLALMMLLRAVETRPTRIGARIAGALSVPLFVGLVGVIAIRFVELSYR